MAKKEEAGSGSKVLGYAKFGAFMHRDNGGKMKISAYSSVNKPLTIDSADETTRVAERTYKIVEEERPELNGSKFYEKTVWNEQTGTGDVQGTRPSGSNDVDSDPENNENNKELTPLRVLKNFVDNLAEDVRSDRGFARWGLILVAVVAVAAFVIALIK